MNTPQKYDYTVKADSANMSIKCQVQSEDYGKFIDKFNKIIIYMIYIISTYISYLIILFFSWVTSIKRVKIKM